MLVLAVYVGLHRRISTWKIYVRRWS